MWYGTLKIKHLINTTFQVTCEDEAIIFHQGTYEDCLRYLNCEQKRKTV